MMGHEADHSLALGEATIQDFRASLRGQLILPGDAAYDDARKVWNGMIDRRPALIVRCAGVADVSKAIRFARDQQLLVAVRGGSHNVTGAGTCDGGLVIDLSPMKVVQVDSERHTARVEPGTTWKEFDQEAQQYGLATTGGLISSTGVAGFTLGGGIGHLVRKYGLTCDNLLSAEVVTAEGELVRASKDENADLFWALRGGGGNFGVVTELELALHPVGPSVLGGVVFYPGAEAAQVLANWQDAVSGAADDLTTLVNLTTAPPAPFLPEDLHGQKVVALVVCWAGSPSEGEEVVRPLRNLGTPLVDLLGPIPYLALQQLVDPLWGPGAANYFTSAFLDQLPGAAIETFADAHRRSAGLPATCELHIHQLGGAMARMAPDATAFSQRQPPYVINCIARTPTAEGFEVNRAWARATRDSMARYGAGRMYVNFTGEADEDEAHAPYPEETYTRLATVKAHYDPTNLFRFN